MKAYSYLETDEWTGGIIFAKSNIEARRLGANILDRDEIAGMQVNRRPDLDQYEQTGVPASVLVGSGWHFECCGCGMHIDEDNLYDKHMKPSDVVGYESGQVFCSHGCRMEWKAEQAGRKAFGQAFVEMMKDVVRKRIPEIEWNFGEFKEHAYVQGSGPFVVIQARVYFDFPGRKHGPATIEYHHAGKYGAPMIGPAQLVFYCPNGDLEAFNAILRGEVNV